VIRKDLGVLTACLFLTSAWGCGGEKGPSLVNVKGTVTLNGAPLEGAEVLFSPDSSNKDGLVGNDVSGPTGNYKAMTQGRAGLVPGKYKVKVTKSSAPKPKPAVGDTESDPYMDQLGAELAAKVGGGGPKGVAAPTVITQEFDREIPPEGGVQDFDLKDKK
jgi:hypothetical protein